MRKSLAPILLLGLAALPAAAQAQYPAYYPQPSYPAYPATPYGYPTMPPQGYYYYAQPTPTPWYGSGYGQPALRGNVTYLPPAAPPATPAATPMAMPAQLIVNTPVTSANTPATATPAATTSARLFTARPAATATAAPKKAASDTTEPALVTPTTSGASAPQATPPITGYSKSALAAPLADPIAADGSAAGTPAGEMCPVNGCPQHHLHVLFSADYLLWSVHGVDVPYAQSFNGLNPATAVPAGQVATVSPGFTSGFRLGAGVGLSDCSWIVGNVTYFRNLNTDSTTAPNGDVLRSLTALPNTVNAAADSLAANASYNFTLLTADFAYKRAFINNDWLTLSWLAGARYAHLDQQFTGTYSITGVTTVNDRVNFDGAGPRIGLDGVYRIGGGFYGYGNGFANLIAGQFTGQALQQNVFAGVQGATTLNENRLVPVLELELGFGWMTANGRVRLSGGYYVGGWFNAMTVPSFQQAVLGTNYTTNGNNNQNTIVFDGFVGRLEFRY